MTTRRQILALVAASASGLAISSAAHAQDLTAQKLPQVTMQTSMGEIVIEVDTVNAPITAQNFLNYVNEGFYDGTIFHRVINNFMIQGGGFTEDMDQKRTHDPIQLEIAPTLKNDRGTLAMARTANPNSATSQFFINVVDNNNLNAPKPDGYGYAVFGRVISGMDVVDAIKLTPTGNARGHQNVPRTPVIIERATITQQ